MDEFTAIIPQLIAAGGVGLVIGLGAIYYASKSTPQWLEFWKAWRLVKHDREFALLKAHVEHLARVEKEVDRLTAELIVVRGEVSSYHKQSYQQALEIAELRGANAQLSQQNLTLSERNGSLHAALDALRAHIKVPT